MSRTEGTSVCRALSRIKGAGSLQTALPLQFLGFLLDKEELRDISLCLKYGWQTFLHYVFLERK